MVDSYPFSVSSAVVNAGVGTAPVEVRGVTIDTTGVSTEQFLAHDLFYVASADKFVECTDDRPGAGKVDALLGWLVDDDVRAMVIDPVADFAALSGICIVVQRVEIRVWRGGIATPVFIVVSWELTILFIY